MDLGLQDKVAIVTGVMIKGAFLASRAVRRTSRFFGDFVDLPKIEIDELRYQGVI